MIRMFERGRWVIGRAVDHPAATTGHQAGRHLDRVLAGASGPWGQR